MLHDSTFVKGVTEKIVIHARDSLISNLLDKGIGVVVDDTNMEQRHVEHLRHIAWSWDVEWHVQDFIHVPVDECVKRDAERAAKGERSVGEKVIRDMHNKYMEANRW